MDTNIKGDFQICISVALNLVKYLVTFGKFSVISVISGVSGNSGESTWPLNDMLHAYNVETKVISFVK